MVGGFRPEDRLEACDQSAAQFAGDKSQPAVHGSDTLPTARWFFLPIATGDRKLGDLGIAFPDERDIARTDRRLLEALIDQIALGLERQRQTEQLAPAQLATEMERPRTALLSSVCHDLRAALVTIIGAACSLAETPFLPPAARQDLAENIRDEGERLDRYVQNLLDLTRLGHGALRARLAPLDLAELIGSARQRMTDPARILVADDEAQIRRFLRVALQSEGHSVIKAATAREALADTARESPGLVILGLGLPAADGLAVLREIRGWSAVPVLILSARSDEAGKVEALDAGRQPWPAGHPGHDPEGPLGPGPC
ncbi:response regulator [Rhodobacter sp. Har01]|uniref:response regulator n=1 Tax=Rhodobacter sp. Har01 TaxID=2883999 RepID=UPI001D05FABC|nr:response regulator [Rhodobacter sp. Har01]MCB6178579.1 response regulator [Rhodobacter sp. Har01]